MPVSISSRYRSAGVHEAPDAEGVVHAAVPVLRHSPVAPVSTSPQYRHRVTGVENIEYLAWRFYANSESWWRIADAYPVRFPLDIRPGDSLVIPSSNEVAASIDRTRSFR